MKRLNTYDDLTGQRFAYLTVLSPDRGGPRGWVRWLCKCDCGEETFAVRAQLVNGEKKSCGCKSAELRRAKAKTRPHVHRRGLPGEFDWTEDAIKRLRELVDAGLSYAKIGDILGCGKNSAISRARRSGMAERGSPINRSAHDAQFQQKKERAAKLMKEGHSINNAARLAGISKHTASKIRRPLGLPHMSGPPPGYKPAPRLPVATPVLRVVAPAPRPPSEARQQVMQFISTPPTMARECQFPLWEHGAKPDKRFCCKPVVALPPYSYCADCRTKAYVKRTEPVERVRAVGMGGW